MHAHMYTYVQGFFVNNISGYAKFPVTCFLDFYQKNFSTFYPKFFPVILFKAQSKKNPIFKPNFWPFLVITTKTISL